MGENVAGRETRTRQKQQQKVIPKALREVPSPFQTLSSSTEEREIQLTTHKLCVVVVSGRWLGEEEGEEEVEDEEAGWGVGVLGVFM